MFARSAALRRTMTGMVAAALAMPTGAAIGQGTGTGGWRVMRDPFADLWFHTMALVGEQGFGTLALYDASYARSVRGGAGAHPRTRDERRLALLRTHIAADSALELLHFVPMYFVGVPPRDALAALRDAAGGAGPGADARDRAHVAARAVVAALPRATERRALLDAVAVAEEEWRVVLAPAGGLARAAAPLRVAALDESWQSRFVPLLGPYLQRSGQANGAIVVSPPLGPNGRVAIALPWGTVVAVGVPGGDGPGPLLAAVRELAYRALDDRVGAPGARGRIAATRTRDAAAVRAGALLLAGDDVLEERYRALYRTVSDRSGRAFEELYPMDQATERALRSALAPAPVPPR